MRKFFIVLILFSSTVFAEETKNFHIDIGISWSTMPTQKYTASNPLGLLRLTYQTKNFSIEYEHQSSILYGPPVNDKLDDRWQEKISVIYRFKSF